MSDLTDFNTLRYPGLPQIHIGPGVYDDLPGLLSGYGNSALLLSGQKALAAGLPHLKKALAGSGISLQIKVFSGDPTRLAAKAMAQQASHLGVGCVLGMGGGRALDYAKAVGHYAGMPVITLPTIPATCAAITALSVMYDTEDNNQDSSFLFLNQPPRYALLHTGILAASPWEYLLAGMGDSLSKHVESHFKATDDQSLSYLDLMGLSLGQMGFETILLHGEQGLADAKHGLDSLAYRMVCQCCIISPGLVSLLVQERLNGALAHSLYYALHGVSGINQLLHGEVVAWGSLVQLVIDGKMEKAVRLKEFMERLSMKTSLPEMGTSIHEIQPFLKEVLQQPDMQHVPYPVSESMLLYALEKTEWLSARKGGRGSV